MTDHIARAEGENQNITELGAEVARLSEQLVAEKARLDIIQEAVRV